MKMVWIIPFSDFGLGFLVAFLASKYVLTVVILGLIRTTWACLNIVVGLLVY